jgi:hypothetical protein
MAKSKFKAAILTAALVAAFPAHADWSNKADAWTKGLRLEYGQGQCQQNRGGKGSWWNDHYPEFLDLNDGCRQLGISARPWKWRGYDVGWRVAYVNFGRVRINSVMAYRDDEQLSNPSGEHCVWGNGSVEAEAGHGCLMRVNGGGQAQGFTFGGLMEKKVWRDLTLGGEAGAFFYHNHFTIRQTAYPDESTTPDWWWFKWDLARGPNATVYLGANARYGWLTVSVRTYAKIVAHDRKAYKQSGVTNGEAWQVNVGISIPLR